MTRDSLVLEIQNGRLPKWLFFWGHKPSKDGRVAKTCFSQWWDRHPFVVDGECYATAEHFMMAEKARLFADGETLSKILEAKNPGDAKKLGRQVSGFDDEVWREARWGIVVRGNRAKFEQHGELKNFLLETEELIIVEASPHDRIWGVGMSANEADIENPARWKGLNLLGFALMEVRDSFNKKAMK